MGLFDDPNAAPRIQCQLHKGYILPCIKCAQESQQATQEELVDSRALRSVIKQKRHKWIKLRIHHYVCYVCGMHKENVEEGSAWWRTHYTFPTTGHTRVEDKVPPCVIGKHTAKMLLEHQRAIDEALTDKAAKKVTT